LPPNSARSRAVAHGRPCRSAAYRRRGSRLATRDCDLAERVVAQDEAIDDIETESRPRHAPVDIACACRRDLREIVGALKISANVERIGDYAARRKRSVIISGQPAVSASAGHRTGPPRAPVRADGVRRLCRPRFAKAGAVWRGDADIDALHTSVFQNLLSAYAVESDHVLPCTHLLFAIKNLERIGDQCHQHRGTIQFLVVAPPHMAEKRPKRTKMTTSDLAAAVKP